MITTKTIPIPASMYRRRALVSSGSVSGFSLKRKVLLSHSTEFRGIKIFDVNTPPIN